jgi:hypothetical protein
MVVLFLQLFEYFKYDLKVKCSITARQVSEIIFNESSKSTENAPIELLQKDKKILQIRDCSAVYLVYYLHYTLHNTLSVTTV